MAEVISQCLYQKKKNLLSLYEVDTKEILSLSSDHIIFLVIYAVIALTFEKGGPPFSLPSCATETVSIPKYSLE